MRARILFLLLFVFLGYLTSEGQVKAVDVEEKITLVQSIKVGDYGFKREKLFCQKDHYYYFSSYDKTSSNKSFDVTKLNLATSQSTTIKFKLNGVLSLQDVSFKESFLVTDNKAFLLGFKKLYVFTRDAEAYQLTHVKILSQSFSKIEYSSDSAIILYQYYDFHFLDSKYKVFVHSYNHKNDSLSTLFQLKTIEGVELSHLVNNFIDIKNNRVAITYPLEYRIEIYAIRNNGLIPVKSINLKNKLQAKKVHTNQVLPLLPRYNGLKARLYLIDSVFRVNSVERLEKVYFLDSNTLFISKLNHGDRSYRSIDVLSISGELPSFLVSDQKYSLTDVKNKGDKLKLQYSLPIFFYDRSILELSYFRLKKLNKSVEKEFTLMRYDLKID
jgi:hypothetical protein